jgi:serine/threonine-protein phosphatase 2B regulatory subunit
MGLCSSSKSIYTKHNHLTQWKNDFDALMVVDSDLEKLYKLFQAIDKDGSGEIDLVELIHYLRLTRTKFNKRVFTIFDEDGSGEIDFREFVVALWNYCTMGKSALTIFAFDLYDLDGSGEIELDEVECKKGVWLFRCFVVYLYM